MCRVCLEEWYILVQQVLSHYHIVLYMSLLPPSSVQNQMVFVVTDAQKMLKQIPNF